MVGVSNAGAEFDRLVAEYYQAWFRYHPEAALDVGIQGFADQLTPYGDDDIGALLGLHEKLLDSLETLNTQDLDPDRALDYRILRGAALIELNGLLQADWRRRDPAKFLPVHAIYQLTVRPLANFSEALQARLEQIPNYLRSARPELAADPAQIPAIWAESAIQEARHGAHYLRALPHHPRVHQDAGHAGRIPGLADMAAHSLEEFAHFIESELLPRARGDFACGRQQFERILRYRHFLDADADQLHAYGERLVQETRAAMREECRRVRGDEDIAALISEIGQSHPDAQELLGEYRNVMRQAHVFVEQRDLVTLPAHQKLQVVETPEFLRHQIPFAAYMAPVPDDPDQCGYYYVTPAQSDEMLREHSHSGLMHTCVHEAWPGHHLQFVLANQRPECRTLPRLLNPSATLYEGWALYSEHLMREQGFLDRPEQGFILLRDRLWRALRILLDVELQVRGLPVEQAIQRMQEVLGFPFEQAKADIIWYTRAPGVPMSYATGWAMLLAARSRLSDNRPDFLLRSFHDQVLASGSIALPLVLERQFGQALASQVCGHVMNS